MIGLPEIETARRRIADGILTTPCQPNGPLSERTGVELWLKLESLQKTGSFKARGALNTLRSLSAEDRARGVIAASAGNHAQGVAWAASSVGARSVIVMPEHAPLIKVTRTRELGGEVVLHGQSFDDAFREAQAICERDGLVFVNAFDDERVIAGQGSIGLELLEQLPDLDAVVVPVGGGGLISGIAAAIKALRPEVAIYGVQTEAAPAMFRSLAAGEVVVSPLSRSLAEGIAMKVPGRLTFPYVQQLVEKLVLVSEAEIEWAIFSLLENAKLLSEGAGAAGVAALLAHRLPELAGKKVAVILCGGNIDLNFLQKIVERSLVRLSRRCKLHITVRDQPGALATMLGEIGRLGANVDRIQQNRTFTDATFWEVEVDLTLETKNAAHLEEILARLAATGYEKVKVLGPDSVV
ncbi:MAG: threonine ammonia-lyase [Thermoanaerobaculia bacterium]|nr:threonine ammonia-lyase [Thermoanaerobaculia bacterium]